MPRIQPRHYPDQHCQALIEEGLPPVAARIYAARGILSTQQLDYNLHALLPFGALKNAQEMACRMADAIAAKKRLLIVADYDSDGATACVVALRALSEFGALVDYVVPNRFEYGYGLTPEIVTLAATSFRTGGANQSASSHSEQSGGCPDILITVDNGITSVEGVAAANRLGMTVLVTDHHLPGDVLPDAACIVNPNQAGCEFPSKNLAGVGVIFYVMLALRAELRRRGVFDGKPEPNLAKLLDLVALGTVADVVKLDDNNRILVYQGLKRIRAGYAHPGIKALIRAAKRTPAKVTTYDLGFAVGPRLNAAGRLDDMARGIACLLCDDEAEAEDMAAALDSLNRERREIEAQMLADAESQVPELEPSQTGVASPGTQDAVFNASSLCLFDPDWHQGVIGILASRLKDKFHRPVIAFALGNNGELKGSGRSIRGLHLRDALYLVAKRHPDLLQRFGGHAAACGLTIRESDLAAFSVAFESVTRSLLSPSDLERLVETDGSLSSVEISLETALSLSREVWGQGFPQPGFSGEFSVEKQRVVGEKHLRLKLGAQGKSYDAILFFHNDPLPTAIRAVYRLDINEYNDTQSLQLVIEYWENLSEAVTY